LRLLNYTLAVTLIQTARFLKVCTAFFPLLDSVTTPELRGWNNRREGVHTLYREPLIEAHLRGQVTRETVLKELGPEGVEEVKTQRDALLFLGVVLRSGCLASQGRRVTDPTGARMWVPCAECVD
jgi:hypothetical protein